MVKSITEVRREEITEAVLSLLARQGPKALSAQTIADAVGMAKASLYQHFASVDEMVEAAILSVHATSMELLRQARELGGSPLQTVRRFIRSMLDMPTVPAAMLSIARIDSESVDKWLQMMIQFRDSLQVELAQEFKAAQAAGEIRTDIAADELVELMTALHHFQKVKHGPLPSAEKDDDISERLERAWEIFCRLVDKRAEF